MELNDRLRAWSHSRQRLGSPTRLAEDALRAVVAVYATHPTCPLALAARTRSLTGARYRRIDRNRNGVRLPAMRKTIFLAPRDHAPRVFTAVRLPPAQALRPLKRIGLSTRDYGRVAKRVLAAAQEPIQAQDLQEAAGIKGQQLGSVLRCLRYEGRLIAVAGESLMMSAHRYVAASAWAVDLDAGDQSEALGWLAGEYLGAYGPARVADFSWWAGVGKRAAAQAIESHNTVEIGESLLLLTRDEAAFGRVKRLRGTVDLLPRWDAYTMGHAPDGRQRFVHPDVQERVYTPIGTGLPGDGNPVVLVDGQAVGVWTYTLKDGPRVEPFDTLGRSVRRGVDDKIEAVAALLNQ
ncbi:MAG: DNA glycosylase AlkZ-like family protein [Actinomycetota bacterium]